MRLHRMLFGRRYDQGPGIRLRIPQLAHAKHHRPARNVMPSRRRNARHRPTIRLKAQGLHPGHRGNLIDPSPSGIDQNPPFVGPRTRGHRPARRRLGNRGHAGICDNLTPIAARLTGKVLQQQIRVDVPSMVAIGGMGQGVVQDRHHRSGLVHADRIQIHIRRLFGQLRRLTRPRQDHQPALRQHLVLRPKVIPRRHRQPHNRLQPIVRLIQCRRPARGVMRQMRLGLQHRDAAQMRQAGGGGNPRDAAADDEKIGHASSVRSVAGGGAG